MLKLIFLSLILRSDQIGKSTTQQQYNDFNNGNNNVIDDADLPIETIRDDEDSQENQFYEQQDVIDLIDD